MGVLPPGDIRNCLVALAETEVTMEKIFQHRFKNGLQNHNLGNLLLVAMTEITGDFVSAIREISRVLAVRGKVIPATLENVNLVALMDDRQIVYGETAIRNSGKRIHKLAMIPEDCQPVPETIKAIQEADALIIGPGSLYSSLIPNLLVEGTREAIAKSPATKIYVSNIMTEAGETDNFNVADHIRTVHKYARFPFIENVIVNSQVLDDDRLKRYQNEKALPVVYDPEEIETLGIKLHAADLLSDKEQAWHDSDKLAQMIMKIVGGK
jgi:uncharacterized cofD-like protein